MGNEIVALKSSAGLLDTLKKSITKKPTAEEIREQRVSFVFGSISEKGGVTRTHVREILKAHEGS